MAKASSLANVYQTTLDESEDHKVADWAIVTTDNEHTLLAVFFSFATGLRQAHHCFLLISDQFNLGINISLPTAVKIPQNIIPNSHFSPYKTIGRLLGRLEDHVTLSDLLWPELVASTIVSRAKPLFPHHRSLAVLARGNFSTSPRMDILSDPCCLYSASLVPRLSTIPRIVESLGTRLLQCKVHMY